MLLEKTTDSLVSLVTKAEEGIINPLLAYAEIKRMENDLKTAKAQVEPLAFQEAENHPGKTFEAEGFKFEKRAGGRSFNFKKISLWNAKKAELDAIEQKAKLAFIAMEKGMLSATEDGEEIELPEPVYRKDFLIVK